jgi:cytochrome c oxidase subunit 4
MAEPKHVTGVGYLATFVALLALATISLLLSYLHWKDWDLVVSLLIAVVKAALVLFFFMHLIEQRFSNRATILVSLMFVALLVGLASADVATRHTFPARPHPPIDQAFYVR